MGYLAGGCDANPGFMVFHFLGNTDDHGEELPRKGMLATRTPLYQGEWNCRSLGCARDDKGEGSG